MKTYRLWLEQDKEFPRFRRLRFEKVEVPLVKLLREGIHPCDVRRWTYQENNRDLIDKMFSLINKGDFDLPEIAELGYCEDLYSCTCYYYGPENSEFEKNLAHTAKSIYFVEKFSYQELLEMAKNRLKEKWNQETVYELLRRCYYDFNSLREFLKSKDKTVKLSGYADIKNYNLARILKLDDFYGKEAALISEGMPRANFRLPSFIKAVTTEEGYFSLVDEIKDFEISWDAKIESEDSRRTEIVYKCFKKDGVARFEPVLSAKAENRQLAQEFARRWRKDKGKYCFSVELEKVEGILENSECRISFPSLNYKEPGILSPASAEFKEKSTVCFRVGDVITLQRTRGDIQKILRNHCRKVSGRKDELAQRLVQLAKDIYLEKEEELRDFFGKQKFIKVTTGWHPLGSDFPLLQGLDIRNLILTMYALNHLRGGVVLEADYENDTYQVEDLARALMEARVDLRGVFLKVE